LLLWHNFYLQVVLRDLVYDFLNFHILDSLLFHVKGAILTVIIDGVDARSTTHLHIHELSVFLHLTFLLLIILVLFPLVVQNLLDVLGLYLRLVLQRLLNRLFFRLLLHLDYVIENLSLTFSSDLAGRFELL